MIAAIYARYSAGPRQTDQSIEGQIADCQRYADAHELVVSKIYADKHISGKSTEGRDQFLQMIADAKKGLFEAVIVWKVDRFGRDKADIAIYKRELKKAGVQLHYAAESVPEGPEGIILESLLEGLAEYYSADLRQKVERGMKESLKKGQYPGHLPFGYMKDKQKNVLINEEQAEIVREVFRLHIEGHSIAEILQILTNKGIFMKNGSIYRILTNKHYLGEFEMYGIKVQVPPIITEEMWEMSSEMMEKPKSRAKVDYQFSGKMVCSECGATFTGSCGTSKSGKIHAYYACKCKHIKPLPKDRYEVTILESVREVALTDELIGQIADRIMEIQSADLPNAEIKRTEVQISDYQKRVDNLLDAVENGLKIDSVQSRLDDYEQKISILTDELDRLKTKKPTIPREYLVKWLESFRAGDLSDDEFCHRLIKVFIQKIIVYSDHSVVVLNITENRDEAECSNLLRLVNHSQYHSNTQLQIALPYALLWVETS